ncbi:MAG TPA: hypothetical protein VIH54_08565, partial [Chthoniobacterales bacterium]
VILSVVETLDRSDQQTRKNIDLAGRYSTRGIVVATLCLCALSVSAAIFLVMDMYDPFRSCSGLQRLHCGPLSLISVNKWAALNLSP